MWGIWMKKWKGLQEKYLQDSRKLEAFWFAKLSNEIWKITEDLWTHQNHCKHEDMGSRINLVRNENINAAIDIRFM